MGTNYRRANIDSLISIASRKKKNKNRQRKPAKKCVGFCTSKRTAQKVPRLRSQTQCRFPALLVVAQRRPVAVWLSIVAELLRIWEVRGLFVLRWAFHRDLENLMNGRRSKCLCTFCRLLWSLRSMVLITSYYILLSAMGPWNSLSMKIRGD